MNLIPFSLESAGLRRFRVLLGLLILSILISQWKTVPLFLSDEGFLPRAALQGASRFSLHLLSGAPFFQYCLVALAMIMALLFTFGVLPSLSAFILWVLLVSMQNRYEPISEGATLYIRVLLLWGICCRLQKAEEEEIAVWCRSRRREW